MAKKQKSRLPQAAKESKEVEKPSLDLPQDDIPEAIVELLDKAPPKAKLGIIQLISQYSGPIPPADEFRKYEEVLAGAADRILTRSEKEQAHRHKMEENHQEKQFKQSFRTQWMAFVLVILSIAVGTYCVYEGAFYVAGIIFSTTIGSILGALVFKFIRDKK